MKPCYIHSTASIHPHKENRAGAIYHATLPEYKEIITQPNLRRRMSHIIKMGVACALQCIQQQENKDIDAIITATGLGCLADTEKFLQNLIENEEELLNPTAFIQSTFNTIGAQIALLTHNHSYNNTFVHRGLSFESALIDALLCLQEGYKQVLVGGVDEITPTSYAIQKRLRLLDGIVAGEGAQFFLLSTDKNEKAYCSIQDIDTFIGAFTPEDILQRMQRLLSHNQLNEALINYLMMGSNGNPKQDKIYQTIEKKFSSAELLTFKDQCGEYSTASAYALWRAANLLKDKKSGDTLLIYNQYNEVNHSLILLQK